MITLGIECSSRKGSLALLKDGELLAEKSWIAERVRHNTIFQTLENLMEEAHISYSDISLFAVGRGPGSFSGMRMSFAVAQALALPGKDDVRAVSSGAALAFAVSREGAKEIAVVGDARRGQVWIGFFQALENGSIKLSNDWKLVAYDEISVPEGTVVVSPEAERLTEIFPTIGSARFPHAKDVAELALLQTQPEPLDPLYMHPPVFVEPKFA
ncbi:MAG: tRNA (adenosine(37)-N6)-threonylcarbamoyltransferase complex dimerization subunit type 1 TsaB [Kiritimatiellales bacterium]|nr:tRNA (adenosine(37)-N6)-threonylcarbamoyltransferase complex dimerization subunit type 1 TsaB [Kiritimatiellota bacterium]MBL7011510.1 tRNA (adenosine(37)-N6)-threonylcarbamoyltransferase complex dimerization subunit type 1 TsaB [Kiritimatiellales bacterium]